MHGVDLADRRILVTGGATGIGAAVTQELLKRGARVAVVQRSAAEMTAALAETALAGDVEPVVADLSSAAGCRTAIRDAVDRLGGLDGLVNNAAATGPPVRRGLAEMDDAYIDWVVDLNLKSVLRCSREAAAEMPPGSAIVAIASVLAQVPQPGSTLYTATKAALVALMKGLAVELGPRGIRAVSVSPGDIDTASSVPPDPDGSSVNRAVRASALGRRGRAAEVAAAVAFLLGDEASYITGTDLLVDGGYLLT